MLSGAGPTTTAAVVSGDQPRAPFPSQVNTETLPQTIPMDRVPNVQASVGQGKNIFPPNPAPLCSVTGAVGVPISISHCYILQ